MLDPYRPIDYASKQIKQRMPSLNNIEQKSLSLLKIMLILLTITFMINVIYWLFCEEEGVAVQPFETVGIGDDFDGKSLSTLLSFDLQKIKNIYESGPKITVIPKSSNRIVPRPLGDFSIPPLSIKSIPLEYSISQIGDIGVEGTSISIGNLLLSMKEFLGNKANTITCSIQRYNSTTFVVAILEDHHSSPSCIMTFEAMANISNDEEIPTLINDLAFQISYALSKRGAHAQEDTLYPKKWQTFKYVTQGRDAYNNYIVTKEIKDLDSGTDMAVLAKDSEPSYNRTYELLSGLGFAYLQNEKYDKAAIIFRNITEYKPFESALGLGLVYGEQGNYAKALNAFDEATQLNPHDAYAWNNKGVILIKQRNYLDAVNAFDNATKLDMKYATSWKYKGDALTHLGEISRDKYSEAIEAYNKATKLNPQYESAWNNKGIALFQLEKYDEAIEAYDETIKLNSSNGDAWCYKGSALYKLENYDEAIKAYDETIKLNSSNGDAWYYKGSAFLSMDKKDDADKAYLKALDITNKTLEIESKNSEHWLRKGLLLYHFGNLEEALNAIDNVNVIDPRNEVAWLIKANLERDLHRYNESIETCNRALQINPNNAQIDSLKGDILKSLDHNATIDAHFDEANEPGS